jgi:myo-inositol-1(or 4)-monophosphatase
LLWVIDPIDGSMNFLSGYPQYSVSIALLSDGEPIAACIVDPCRQEVFSAALNHGATLNGKPLQVAGTDLLQLAIAATVFPKPRAASLPDYLIQFDRAVSTVAGVRRSGSMVLELAYLAAGRVDVFWSHDMGSWDTDRKSNHMRTNMGQALGITGLQAVPALALALGQSPAICRYEPFWRCQARP